MSRRYQVLAALSLAIAACSSDPQSSAVTGIGSASAQTKGAITVFAAASLTEAFGAAGTALHAAQPRVEVTFDFAASGTLVAQLEQGAPADVVAEYPIAIVKATTHRAAAQAFIDSVVSGSGRNALEQYGFLGAS